MDGLLNIDIPGLGLAIILFTLALIGYVGSVFFANPFFKYFEGLISTAPLVKLLYGSIKDLVSAFVGDKRRFKAPVRVKLSGDGAVEKLGFVTQDDLSHIGIHDKVAVYFPHSYNFSGNLFLVPRENVVPINASGTEIMKFIVSGGVTDVHPDNLDQEL